MALTCWEGPSCARWGCPPGGVRERPGRVGGSSSCPYRGKPVRIRHRPNPYALGSARAGETHSRGPALHVRTPPRGSARVHRRALWSGRPGGGRRAESVTLHARPSGRAVRHQGPDVRRGVAAVAGLPRAEDRAGHARHAVGGLARRPAVRQRGLRLVPRRLRALRLEDGRGHQRLGGGGPGAGRARRAPGDRGQRGQLAEVRTERGRWLGLQPGQPERRQLHRRRDRCAGAGRCAARRRHQGGR